MTTANDIFSWLCEFAPLELQANYDNAGFLVGRRESAVSHVLLSLDVTEEVIAEAAEKHCELIISHHPLIWDAMKQICDDELTQRKLITLLEHKMAVISMHTNLDITQGGVNDVLLSLMGAEPRGYFEEENCGRMGEYTQEMSMQDFLQNCKQVLHANGLRYYDALRPVKRLAVLGGAGGSNVMDAYRAGCDTYLTGDIKYHDFLLAREIGLNLIDGDHFCTEAPVMLMLRQRLSKLFPEVEFFVSERHDQTSKFI